MENLLFTARKGQRDSPLLLSDLRASTSTQRYRCQRRFGPEIAAHRLQLDLTIGPIPISDIRGGVVKFLLSHMR